MRNAIIELRGHRASGQHAGLILQRYLAKAATGTDGDPEERKALLEAAVAASKNQAVRALYQAAWQRWRQSLPEGSVTETVGTYDRLIAGLGTENVLETGIHLQHTFGMPYLPGSSLKGLASHYCDQVWGAADPNFKVGGPCHGVIFATTNDELRKAAAKEDRQGDCGCVVFHNAWLVPEQNGSPLRLDVMTPHHPKWLDGQIPPTDFDSPIPVSYLSVSGRFELALSWCGPATEDPQTDGAEAAKWLALTMKLLKEALGEWGIGGKTSSGYGRLRAHVPVATKSPGADE